MRSTILKILTGPQAGVEIPLLPGSYTLGSGLEDDLQFLDNSSFGPNNEQVEGEESNLKPSHAKLTISESAQSIAAVNGNVFIGGNASNAVGELLKKTGEVTGGDEGGEKEAPLNANEAEKGLDELTAFWLAGVAFALGSPNSDWNSVILSRERVGLETEFETGDNKMLSAGRETKASKQQSQLDLATKTKPRVQGYKVSAFYYAASFFGLLFLGGLLFWFYATHQMNTNGGDLAESEVTPVRLQQILKSLDFASNVEVRTEVDGNIFVEGYVEKPVERRAIKNRIEDAEIDANIRVWVLDSIRREVASLLESQGHDLDFVVDDKGVLTLTGNLLNNETAARFNRTVQDEIPGLSELAYQVKSTSTYLQEVKQLARKSSLDKSVLLFEQGESLEASGIVTEDKLDAWVGFIQVYARKYADHIPLRSFVQLVDDSGQVIAAPDKHRSDGSVLISNLPIQPLETTAIKTLKTKPVPAVSPAIVDRNQARESRSSNREQVSALLSQAATPVVATDELMATVPVKPIVLREEAINEPVRLDVQKIRSGQFDASEVFRGSQFRSQQQPATSNQVEGQLDKSPVRVPDDQQITDTANLSQTSTDASKENDPEIQDQVQGPIPLRVTPTAPQRSQVEEVLATPSVQGGVINADARPEFQSARLTALSRPQALQRTKVRTVAEPQTLAINPEIRTNDSKKDASLVVPRLQALVVKKKQTKLASDETVQGSLLDTFRSLWSEAKNETAAVDENQKLLQQDKVQPVSFIAGAAGERVSLSNSLSNSKSQPNALDLGTRIQPVFIQTISPVSGRQPEAVVREVLQTSGLDEERIRQMIAEAIDLNPSPKTEMLEKPSVPATQTQVVAPSPLIFQDVAIDRTTRVQRKNANTPNAIPTVSNLQLAGVMSNELSESQTIDPFVTEIVTKTRTARPTQGFVEPNIVVGEDLQNAPDSVQMVLVPKISDLERLKIQDWTATNVISHVIRELDDNQQPILRFTPIAFGNEQDLEALQITDLTASDVGDFVMDFDQWTSVGTTGVSPANAQAFGLDAPFGSTNAADDLVLPLNDVFDDLQRQALDIVLSEENPKRLVRFAGTANSVYSMLFDFPHGQIATPHKSKKEQDDFEISSYDADLEDAASAQKQAIAVQEVLPVQTETEEQSKNPPAKEEVISSPTEKLVVNWSRGKAIDAIEVPGLAENSEDMIAILDSIAEVRNENQSSVARQLEASQPKVRDLLPLTKAYIDDSQACWPRSNLAFKTLPTTLLLLDYLSFSDATTLVDFAPEQKRLILEAVLNPNQTFECAQRFYAQENLTIKNVSLGLNEITKNPGFIHFLTRDVKQEDLRVTGAVLQQNHKFIQLQSARKVFEGSAFDPYRKLVSVGELGLLIQVAGSYSTLIYDDRLNWKIDG